MTESGAGGGGWGGAGGGGLTRGASDVSRWKARRQDLCPKAAENPLSGAIAPPSLQLHVAPCNFPLKITHKQHKSLPVCFFPLHFN